MVKKIKILAIDTSNKSSSVSVLENEKVVGDICLDCGLVHSKVIYGMVSSVLKLTSNKIGDIDLFSVCIGPGSYTGIRIGVSLCKGISLSISKKFMGISSLLSLANSVTNLSDEHVIYSCIIANKDELYFNSYDFCEETREILQRGKDMFISFSELSEIIKNEHKRIMFVGNASNLCYNLFGWCGKIDDVYDRKVESKFVGLSAYREFLRGEGSDICDLSPNYLKKVKIEGDIR